MEGRAASYGAVVRRSECERQHQRRHRRHDPRIPFDSPDEAGASASSTASRPSAGSSSPERTDGRRASREPRRRSARGRPSVVQHPRGAYDHSCRTARSSAAEYHQRDTTIRRDHHSARHARSRLVCPSYQTSLRPVRASRRTIAGRRATRLTTFPRRTPPTVWSVASPPPPFFSHAPGVHRRAEPASARHGAAILRRQRPAASRRG